LRKYGNIVTTIWIKLYPLKTNMSTLVNNLTDILNGQSSRNFCKVNDLSRPSFQKYISGKSEPTLSSAKKIADAAGVSLDWLAGRVGARKDYVPFFMNPAIRT